MKNIKVDREKIEENFKNNSEKKALFKSFGYDIDIERNFIIDAAKPFSGRILEAGTGKGNFSLALAMKGYYFISFDISKEEQNFAKLNLEYFNLCDNVNFRIENAESLSFDQKSFDVIFTVNVLHHLKNPIIVLDELIRVLSKNGKLILADFTDKGFDIMDKIHALENNTHDRGILSLNNAAKYLLEKGLVLKEFKTLFQHVIAAIKV